MRADVLVVLGVLLVATPLLRRVRTRDWFHPFLLPTAYVLLTLVVPFVYVSLTGRWLWDFGGEDLSPSLISICAIAFLSMWIGIVVGCWRRTDTLVPAGAPGEWNLYFARVRMLGLVLLGVLAPMAVWLLVESMRVPYGNAQLTYGLSSVLKAVIGVGVLPAVALVGVGGVGTFRRMPRRDWVAIGVLLALLAAAGNRSVPLSSLIFLAFLHHEAVWRIRLRAVVAGAAAMVLLMVAVVLWRSGSPSSGSGAAMVQTAVESVASPVGITARLLEVVPGETGYFMGSTYLAAAEYLLPGPIARALLGEPSMTGSLAYRDLIDFRDESQGLGFSLMAEAYLNFGPAGVAVALGAFGLLLARAWRLSRPLALRARDLLYPILIAQLPYLLRTDALSQVKMILYSQLLLYGALRASWVLTRSERPGAPASKPRTHPGARPEAQRTGELIEEEAAGAADGGGTLGFAGPDLRSRGDYG